MRLRAFRSAFGFHLRATLGAVVLAMLALASVASVYEPLHDWLHPDAGCHDHDCAAKMLSTGGCDPGCTPALDTSPGEWLAETIAVPPRKAAASRDERNGILEHAPPARRVVFT